MKNYISLLKNRNYFMIKRIYRKLYTIHNLLFLKLLRKYQQFILVYIGLYNSDKYIKLLNKDDANALIIEKIFSKQPLMISRYGSVEFYTFTTGKGIDALYNNAGFFPKDDHLIKEFRNIYYEASREIDILGIWFYKYTDISHWKRKVSLIKTLPNLNYLIELHTLNPYDNNWIKALKNKRVLVVHPFKSSIEKQYQIREKIGLLPKLKSLEIIQAIQTIADVQDPRFQNWFDALEYMKREISTKEFDICLIGCGAYGLPLATHVKNMGKQAIHIGGALQLLFGIKGRRWEDEYDFKFDENWIYPLEEDRPVGAKKVENACYW